MRSGFPTIYRHASTTAREKMMSDVDIYEPLPLMSLQVGDVIDAEDAALADQYENVVGALHVRLRASALSPEEVEALEWAVRALPGLRLHNPGWRGHDTLSAVLDRLLAGGKP